MENYILTSKSTPEEVSPTDYEGRDSYNYLWQLLDLESHYSQFRDFEGMYKDGFARAAYKNKKSSTGFYHGGQSRIIGTLRDIERAFDLDVLSLRARVVYMKRDDWDVTMSAEQFVHFHNEGDKVMNKLSPTMHRRWMKFGGKTEFYAVKERTILGRFANSWRKRNLEIGREIMQGKRQRDEHGVPEFAPQIGLEGGVA